MKERPILFSAPMIRAIQEGRKTQTRRALKFPKWSDPKKDADKLVLHNGLCCINDCGTVEKTFQCPYGVIGDRLWVRETFFTHGERVEYRADYCREIEKEDRKRGLKWKPSIFMPRWASRITLEITDIRVERLQKISAADSFAEGVTSMECVDRQGGKRIGYSADWSRIGEMSKYIIGLRYPENEAPLIASDICLGSPRMAFANLWIKINGRDSWDENPWVFVISFKKT